MSRQYTKAEILSEEVKLLKAAEKINREIEKSRIGYGLDQGASKRQNKKVRYEIFLPC